MNYSKIFFISFLSLVSCAKDNVNLATVKVNLENKTQSSELYPLIIFYSGFGQSFTNTAGKIKEFIQAMPNKFKITKKFYSWEQESISINYLQEHLIKHPNSPIALVGHSYGGDTAYKVAASIKGKDILSLFTLDPVGHSGINNNIMCIDFQDRECNKKKKQRLKPSSVLIWYNIWVSGGSNFGDIISTIGEDWKEQTHATKNIFLKDTHNNALTMFRQINNLVTEYLNVPMSTTK